MNAPQDAAVRPVSLPEEAAATLPGVDRVTLPK
jgi:hypothetical protein